MTVDELAKFAIQRLLSGKDRASELVHDLALASPNSTAFELVLALSIAASSIESALSSIEDRSAAQDGWRMASLLALDVFMMRKLEMSAISADDLLSYWMAKDPYFLPTSSQ